MAGRPQRELDRRFRRWAQIQTSSRVRRAAPKHYWQKNSHCEPACGRGNLHIPVLRDAVSKKRRREQAHTESDPPYHICAHPSKILSRSKGVISGPSIKIIEQKRYNKLGSFRNPFCVLPALRRARRAVVVQPPIGVGIGIGIGIETNQTATIRLS